MKVRFEANNAHDAGVTRCLLMTHSGHSGAYASDVYFGGAHCAGASLLRSDPADLVPLTAGNIWKLPRVGPTAHELPTTELRRLRAAPTKAR
jgi:hypothetical protein